ncbi:MAG: hypothetical protein IKR05_13125 [Prevotella sp.]|nr:hypothetical protein [Prevotella sp.]
MFHVKLFHIDAYPELRLLEAIKAQLSTMDHPFDKQETRATIIITIRDVLWKELPESYSDESINYYRDAVYQYVSQRYGEMASTLSRSRRMTSSAEIWA